MPASTILHAQLHLQQRRGCSCLLSSSFGGRVLPVFHNNNHNGHIGQQQVQVQQRRSLQNWGVSSLFASVKTGYYDNINKDEISLQKLLEKAASVRSKWSQKSSNKSFQTETSTTNISASALPSELISKLLSTNNIDNNNDDDLQSLLYFSSSYDARETKSKIAENDNDNDYGLDLDLEHKRGFSNWIIPGKIMVGQYPGRVPEKTTPTLQETRDHIQNVLVSSSPLVSSSSSSSTGNKTNICFVSLQSEVPPQKDNQTWNNPQNNGEIYLTSRESRNQWPNPFSHYKIEVDSLINTRNRNTDSDDDDAIQVVNYIHHPIKDLSVPSNSNSLRLLLWKLLSFLDNTYYDNNDNSNNNNTNDSMLYIHCWGGRGRAGLTACCLLTLLAFADTEDNATAAADTEAVAADNNDSTTDDGTTDSTTITTTPTDDSITVDTIFKIVQSGYNSRLGSINMPIELQQSPQTESQRTFVNQFFQEVQQASSSNSNNQATASSSKQSSSNNNSYSYGKGRKRL